MEATGFFEHRTRIAGLFELAVASDGHVLIVENPGDPSQYVQAMVFPDGLVNLEMSAGLAARMNPEVLEAEGWHLPGAPLGPDDVANPSRMFEVGGIDRAAEEFCAVVDRIERTGPRWWSMEVFPRVARHLERHPAS